MTKLSQTLSITALLWCGWLLRVAVSMRFALLAALFGVSALPSAAQVGVVGQAGARDRDFGALVSTGQSGVYLVAANTMTSALGAGMQSNGLPIVVGVCNANPTEDMCVARLNRDGWQLDSTFGSGGLSQYVLAGQDYPRASVIDAADRIILAGSCNGVGLRACIIRLNANGSLDASFGSGGRGGVSGMLEITAMRLDSDGRKVVAGECFQSSERRPCVARLTASGSLDPSFNGGALLIFSFPNATYQVASGLAFDASGRILISAFCNAAFNSTQYGRFCAMRITAAGVLDPSFNGGVGRLYALQNATTSCSASAIAAQSDGRIVVVGSCNGANGGRFAASRLTESGNFDTAFGQDAFAGLSYQWIERDLYVGAAKVHIDETNRILLSGTCQLGFCLARMLPNGRADPLFGDRAVVIYKPDAGFEQWQQNANHMHILGSNRLLLVGECTRGSTDRRACVTRHYIDSPPGERCSLDLDGDGEINAATDALLWARVHLGIRGAALTQNAIGERAQRTSAGILLAHLATHCGIR